MKLPDPSIDPELTRSPLSPVVWFAVLGSPAAWALQFGVGYWLSQARCSPAGGMWGISLDAWAIVLSALAIPIAVAAGLSGLAIYRTTGAELDDPPPAGRNRFLATVSMAITPIFVAIMALNLVGVLTYSHCPQS